MTKNLQSGDLLTCHVKHAALHASNIHVRVVSYLPSSKGRSNLAVNSGEAALVQALNPFRAPSPTPTATGNQGRGVQNVNVSGALPASTDTEEFVFTFPNLSTHDCAVIANSLLAELSRKEFILTVEFAPTAADIQMLAQYGTEIYFQLAGATQNSHNLLYYPKHVSWTYNPMGGGIKIQLLCFNHVVPPPTGSLVNTAGSTG
jgi:hypothetical protein